MEHSRYRSIIACLSMSAALGSCSSSPPFPGTGSASGYDLVLVTLDTTRADRLGSYGYDRAETPHLDRLAKEGIRFADAVSPAPITLVAHASMLTGLDPDHHGVRHNGQYRLDPSHATLAEVLSGEGYETAAFVSAFVLDARYGLAQGFATYDDRIEPLPGQPFGGLGERSATAVTDAALAWLRDRSPGKPFFLWVHYYDPHAQYQPPEAFATRFPDRPYDGEIAYMDSEIGRLMEALEKSSPNLLVLVAGDHGEGFGEHGEYSHSRLLYETTQRVPLFLWSRPALASPGVVDDVVVGLTDIFPTVVDLLGMEPSEETDGISLRVAREDQEREIYLETMASYLDNGWAPLYALRRHRDKYILAPRPEFYELASDPLEIRNLYASRAKTVSPLAEALARRVEGGPSPEEIAASAVPPDSEALRQLQALGYLAGPGPRIAQGPSSSLPDPKDMMGVQSLLMESRGLRKEGRLEEAEAKARQAFERAPEDLEVLEEVGLVYVEGNRLEEAERAFRALIERKPNPNIYILLAEILAETARKDEGVVLLERAMELEPDHGGVLITRGDFLAKDGKYEEALASYEKAKEVDPYRATTIANRRIVELRLRLGGGS